MRYSQKERKSGGGPVFFNSTVTLTDVPDVNKCVFFRYSGKLLAGDIGS